MAGINVLVVGALGKMGRETVRAVKNSTDIRLAGAVDVKASGRTLDELTGDPADKMPVYGNLEEAMTAVRADVMVDFTNPQAVFTNARLALRNGMHCVIGTTGLGEAELSALEQMAKEKQVGCAVIPNFALGAVLMMRFAAEAARYFKDVEIIELHHNGKMDAPSGTAIKTAEMIVEARSEAPSGIPGEFEKLPGSRGGSLQGVHIHSVRLPGLIAHQEVIFGGIGQVLTIRHDSMNRESFMPGVLLVIRKIDQVKGLVYGLEYFM